MENYLEQLKNLEQKAQEDVNKLFTSFENYVPIERAKLQLAERQKLIQKHAQNAKTFLSRLQVKMDEFKRERVAKRYPLSTATLSSDRLLGEMQQNTALLMKEPFPYKAVSNAIEQKRYDLASALIDRWNVVDTKTPELKIKSLDFERVEKQYDALLGVKELDTQMAELEKVIKKAKVFIKQVEDNLDVSEPKNMQELYKRIEVQEGV